MLPINTHRNFADQPPEKGTPPRSKAKIVFSWVVPPLVVEALQVRNKTKLAITPHENPQIRNAANFSIHTLTPD